MNLRIRNPHTQGRLSMPASGRGFSLVELVVALTLLLVLLSQAVPAFGDYLANNQVRNAGRNLMAGLQYARGEAVKRNTQVRLSLVDSLTGDCKLSNTGPDWMISRHAPDGKCNETPVVDFLDPDVSSKAQILRRHANADNSAAAAVTATTVATTPVAVDTVVFNGLGRLVSPASAFRIDITNPGGGSCVEDSGRVRCLRITVDTSGEPRLCDPAVVATGDTRAC